MKRSLFPALAACVWLLAIPPAFTALAADAPTPAAAVLELEKGNQEKALKLLKTYRKRSPGDPAGYAIAARALLQVGQSEEAKKLLKTGLRAAKEKGELSLILGLQLLTEARDGPGVTRTAHGMSFKPANGIDEDVFRLKRLRDAERHLRVAHASEAFEFEATPPLIFALGELGRHDAALAVAQEALDAEHPDPRTLCGAIDALNKLGRSEESLELARLHLPYFERSGSVWYLLSQTHELLGNAEKASDCLDRALFFNRLPDFIDVVYSSETADQLRRLFGQTENATSENSLFGSKMDLQAAEQSIDDLTESSDPDAPKLLAAFCFSHIAHGDLEDRAFDVLADSGQEEILLAILDNARSACTAGGALRALARMKSDKCFDLLAQRLSKDEGYFSMGIAQSMAQLGDERAVPLLIGRLDSAARAAEPREIAREPMALLQSYIDTGALVRALSAFGTPEALAAIRRHLQSEELAFVARAALYRHTSDPQLLAELGALLDSGRPENAYNALAILAELPATPENQALLDRLRAIPE